MASRASDAAHTASLDADPDRGEDGHRGVSLRGLGPAAMAALRDFQGAGGELGTVLRVAVAGSAGPGVAGRCSLAESGLRFIPYFPFEAGLTYRATFDASAVRGFPPAEIMERAFCLPRPIVAPPTVVDQIFPSGDQLPDNLLRFYLCFSNPMARGHVGTEISLLGPNGHPAADVLYRPPVELWDGSMRVLTLLLDPGRLKRGVGPNRELGPPLEAGQAYTLVVGGGMTDRFGRRLGAPVRKRFGVCAAVRRPVAFDAWTVVPPAAGSREPLVILFSAALDWAMLFNTITIATSAGELVQGCVAVGQSEQRWAFTPSLPWAAGAHRIQVEAILEDSCGNSLLAAFDRPIRPGGELPYEAGIRCLPFIVA